MRFCALGLFLLLAPSFALADIPPPDGKRTPSMSQRMGAQSVKNALFERRFDDVIKAFDAAMAKALPKEKLSAVWDAAVPPSAVVSSRVDRQMTMRDDYAVLETVVTMSGDRVIILTLSIGRDGKVAGLFLNPARPPYQIPDYAKPVLYQERKLTIGTDVPLSAVLTTPKGKGPYPGIVLVHGSGPNDQDETTVGGSKPFADLAAGLASRGVAVLRYDKRSRAHPEWFAGRSYTVEEETLADARAAIALLQKTPGVDGKRISVLGHSLGGYLAPRLAKGTSSLRAIVLLAGSTRPLLTSVREQLAYLKVPPEAVEPALTKFRSSAPASYWQDLDAYSPTETIKPLKLSVLVLQGEADYQVTMKDFADWKVALAGNKQAQLKSYPKLNHAFVLSDGEHVPVQVIDDIATFLRRPIAR